MLWLILMLMGGCATHLAPNPLVEHRYKTLPWAEDYNAGRAEALMTDRLVMLVLVAGKRDGLC